MLAVAGAVEDPVFDHVEHALGDAGREFVGDAVEDLVPVFWSSGLGDDPGNIGGDSGSDSVRDWFSEGWRDAADFIAVTTVDGTVGGAA